MSSQPVPSGQCFVYDTVSTPAGLIPRPMATMTITGPSGAVNVDALFDSGSDVILIPKSVGQSIGWNPTAQINTYGVSGSSAGELFTGMITFAGQTFSAPVFVSVDDSAPILIGRASVWNRFKTFTFYNDQQEVCFGDATPQIQQFLQSPQILTLGAVTLGFIGLYILLH